LVELIQEAHTNGSRIEVDCREAGLSLHSYRRWFQRGEVQVDKRPDTKKPEPENKLSKDEKQAIVMFVTKSIMPVCHRHRLYQAC
jgi:putative transposase